MNDGFWIIASGQDARIGDLVALARHPDSTGRIIGISGHHTGAPDVELTAGPGAGKVVTTWPSDILLRLTTR